MIRFFPLRELKQWRTSFRGPFFGDIIQSFNVDLRSKSSEVTTGGKMYPHTIEGDVSGIDGPSAFHTAKISDGMSRVSKIWALATDKALKSLASTVPAFSEDNATGLGTTGSGSDITSVGDESGEAIETTQVSIGVGSLTTGAFKVTGEGNFVKWAQSFKASGPLSKVTLDLRKVGSPSDNLKVSIQEDSSGDPSGSDLTSINVAGSDLTTSFVETDLLVADFTSSLQFDVEKTYWLVLERDGASDTGNYFEARLVVGGEQNDGDDPYEDGTLKNFNDTDNDWERVIMQKVVETFSADGTFTVPSGVTELLKVECWGAGGGGTTDTGAGGGGAYSRKENITCTPGEDVEVLVGTSSADTDGGDSKFNAVDALVIAGGGGGAQSTTEASIARGGGGGGGGGYLEENINLALQQYTITVGSGGAGGSSSGDPGSDGEDSVIQGLLTATGGGGGGAGANRDGRDGGSGGGGGGDADTSPGSGGTGSQGKDGGDGFASATVGNRAGGGGGGASTAGSNGTSGSGGDGGDGLSSDITGSSVTRAGGGGGQSTAHGSGGSGGGGDAGGTGTNGTANTGGGGGAGGGGGGGTGGSGIVVIRYRTGTITATGGTKTTDGNYTVHTFTSNGTFEVTAIGAEGSVVAKGGKSGTNGSAGGQATDGEGTTKFSGGDGSNGTGSRGGGGGAGDEANGGDGGTGDSGGSGGATNGGQGDNHGAATGARALGGGGRSNAGSQTAGARGEVRVTYMIPVLAEYPAIAGRAWGRRNVASGNQHTVTLPSGVLPGDLLMIVFSTNEEVTVSAPTGWTKLGQEDQSTDVTQAVLYKIADGTEGSSVTVTRSSGTVGSSHVALRIANGGTPTITQATGTSGNADPPNHTIDSIEKTLWIATASVKDGPSSIDGHPTNFRSLIWQPSIPRIISGGGEVTPITGVAERLTEAVSENPGTFSNTSAAWVAGTISVPFKKDVFLDAEMSIVQEFPQADERLYITTDDDVQFLNQEGGVWQSLWRGILQQDALDTNYPHPMKNLGVGGVLIVGDGNKIHSMTATGTSAEDATAERITVRESHFNTWLVVTKSAIFAGFEHKDSELLPSLVLYYEPFSEYTRVYEIQEGSTVGWLEGENCHILDKSGQMRAFTGSAFQTYDFFPPYFRNEKITTLPHRNGVKNKDGATKFFWEGQYPFPAGVWEYYDKRLYHKHSLVFDKVNFNSIGAMEGVGAKALYDRGDKLLLGASVTDDTEGTVEGVFADFRASGVTVETDTRAHFKTSKISSASVDDSWNRIYGKILDGSIVLKKRVSQYSGEEDQYDGDWTSSTTFTTTDSDFKTAVDNGDIVAGDEVIIRKGQGAGLLVHIVSITGTSTRTVTIDEGLDDVSSGDFKFSVEHWVKLGQNKEMAGDVADWLQVKSELRGTVLEELQVAHKSNESLDE